MALFQSKFVGGCRGRPYDGGTRASADLGVGTSVKELSLEIDFRSLPYVRVECFLDVSIPTPRSLAGMLLHPIVNYFNNVSLHLNVMV